MDYVIPPAPPASPATPTTGGPRVTNCVSAKTAFVVPGPAETETVSHAAQDFTDPRVRPRACVCWGSVTRATARAWGARSQGCGGGFVITLVGVQLLRFVMMG